MLVGETPGDVEDRKRAHVSNAVKHFKFHREGKRRIHEKPVAAEIRACRPWLRAELRAVADVLP